MEEQEINKIPETETPRTSFRYFPFFNHKQPVFVLILIGVIFYCTSLYNEYALDDGIVIHQNNYVLRGVSGIPDIITRDLYDAFYRRMNATDQLQGGRYHPLPIITYAIEQEIIGAYRTGFYEYVVDINRNGVLDDGKIKTSSNSDFFNGESTTSFNWTSSSKKVRNASSGENSLNIYEYNDYVDINQDQVAQANECNNCWDRNKNFRNDPWEDLNADGVFNEVDCQVKGAFLRHFNNMWIYILACVLLYRVFRKYFFKENHDLAFLAALIFLTHPVHSEVVANVKGRDEFFSTIFMALTFLFSFKFMETKKTITLITASVMFLLALLSKEYALMLLLLVPVALYVFNRIKLDLPKLFLLSFTFLLVFLSMIELKLYLTPSIPGIILVLSGFVLFIVLSAALFRNMFFDKGVNALMIGFFAFGLLYVGMRLNAVSIAPGIPDTELLNDPYLFANGEEKFATKVFILLKYLVLAVFPKNLTSDYSYASIAYRNLGDADFMISLLINLLLLITGVVLTVKRHVIGFAIITYFAFLLLVSNFIFAVGCAMREGFLFHAAIGIAIALAWVILKFFDKLPSLSFARRRGLLLGSLLILVFLYGCKTWERNWDWKNDVTLFLKDVKSTPNSVLVLGNAGARWIDLADTKEITGIIEEGGSKVYNDYNGTLKITNEEMSKGGYKTKREAALYKGIGYLEHAIKLHPRYVNGYLNLGLASFKLQKDFETVYYWKLAEHFYPNNPYLENYYRVYSSVLNNRGSEAFSRRDFSEAAKLYTLWTLIDPKSDEALYNLGGVYFNQGNYTRALKCWEMALELNPSNEKIKNVLKLMPQDPLTPK